MVRFRTDKVRHDVNLWVVPLKVSLAAILLFAFTLTLDLLAASHHLELPGWFTMGGIDDARAILGAMLGCVSTVLALIFSVTLLVLSMVANLFGPRLLYRFVQDWVTQVCIGLFMGAFIYVFLVFLVTHQDEHSSFIPQVSLITSWFVVLAAFSFLVFYSHRVAVLIQNPDAIGRIVDDLRTVVRQDSHGAARSAPRAQDELTLRDYDQDHAVLQSRKSGYLQLIQHARLVAATQQINALIVIPVRPGQFVLEGEPIAYIYPAGAARHLESTVWQTVTLGRHRVLRQDIEFGLAQIVEIGIRALSPAVNDTFTGIACVDLLGEALTLLSTAPTGSGRWYDTTGTLRLQIRPLLICRLIRQAFDQIRQAAADNPAVSIRLLNTLTRLATTLDGREEREALWQQANAVWESALSKSPVTLDRTDLESAWLAARAATVE